MSNPYDIGRLVGKVLAEAILTETSAKQVIAVYSGRFQPFHRGHYSIYESLVSKFGINNVYIGTSGVVDSKKSPFSFSEKKEIITRMFRIPDNRVVQVKNPFAPEEILKKYNPDTTVYVTAFSEKDAGRLSGKYFKEYPSGHISPTELEGYETRGYYIVAPEKAGVSGTQIRADLGNKTSELSDKKDTFYRYYGHFDKSIFDLMVSKLTEGRSMISRVLIEKYHVNRWRRQLLREGGAAGHLAHPFEDQDLTFGDLKTMVDLGLSGELNVEAPITEKLDGQNIAVSFRDDRGVIFARNKSHIKNHGLNAMNVDGVRQMFSGRGDVSDAFSLAASDLESAILSLTDKQREKVFENGSKFVNVEVIFPATQNVVPYGLNMLVLHNTIQFDDDGNQVGTDSDAGRMLAGMIKQINQNVQKTFEFRGPVVVSLPRTENFEVRKGRYLNKINGLESQFGLRDSDRVMMWHQRWWEDFITAQAEKYKYSLPNDVLDGLLKRWAFLDTGAFTVSAMKARIGRSDFLDWVLSFDKTDHDAQVKKNMAPFELIFLELGAEILENARGLVSLSPGPFADSLRRELDSAVKELSSTTDVKKLSKLKDNLQKIEAIGTEKLVPTEGIVFVYKGKLYKLTGVFAPLNQILGMLKF